MTPQVRPFDLAKIPKLTSRQVAISQSLLELYPQLAEIETMGSAIFQNLERDLGLKLQLQFNGLEESSFSGFTASLPNPCLAVMLKEHPSGQRLILEVDYLLARQLVDRLLGGIQDFSSEARALSPIEEGILEYLLVKALSQIKDAPGLAGMGALRISKIVQEAKLLAESSNPEEMGCVFKFYLGLGDRGGYLRIYFPHPLVEGLLLREDMISAARSPEKAQLLAEGLERVSHIKTSLWSEIGRVSLMASEKAQLEKGDVILFDETLATMGPQGITGKAILRVGEMPSEGLLAEVIDTAGKMTVKILDFYGGD